MRSGVLAGQTAHPLFLCQPSQRRESFQIPSRFYFLLKQVRTSASARRMQMSMSVPALKQRSSASNALLMQMLKGTVLSAPSFRPLFALLALPFVPLEPPAFFAAFFALDTRFIAIIFLLSGEHGGALSL
jgi:hypothetical protein